MRRPYWKKSHGCWYVNNAAGKPVRLDPDDDAAHTIWQRMREAEQSLSHPNVPFRVLANEWLRQHQAEFATEKYRQLRRYLSAFCQHVGAKAAGELDKGTVYDWLRAPKQRGSHKTLRPWSPSTQRDVVGVIKRVLRWAHANGLIARNPLHDLRAPRPSRRERTITYEEHTRLVAKARSQRHGKPFALYLIASRCGARPQQIRDVTAEHIAPGGQAWIFRQHKTAHKTHAPLIVYPSPCLQTLAKILAARHPSGPLFRTAKGTAWTKDAVVQRFRRLREQLGITDVVAYAYRHSFATEAMLAGVPIATVAELLGHTNTRMVSEYYGHLAQHPEHLTAAAKHMAQHRLPGND
jgi:integrase